MFDSSTGTMLIPGKRRLPRGGFPLFTPKSLLVKLADDLSDLDLTDASFDD
jgi:hypothetical protein